MKIFEGHEKRTTNTRVPTVHQVSASHICNSRSAGCHICSLLFDQLKAYEELFRKSTKKSRSSPYTVCDVEANADEVELVPGHDETDPYDDRVKASGLNFSFKFRWTNAMRYSYRSDFPPPVEYYLMADKSIDSLSTDGILLTYHQKSLKHLPRRNQSYPEEAIRSGLFKNIGSRHAAKTTLNVAHTKPIGCLPGSLNSFRILPRKFDCYNHKKDNSLEII
jgi:hypothetical protein